MLRARHSSVVIAPMPTVRSQPDRVLREQLVVLGDAALDDVAQVEHALLPAVGQVGRDAAGADEVVVHPQAGDVLE